MRLNQNKISVLIIFLVAILNSLDFFYTFGADYGIYFTGAKNANLTYPIYEGFFDHKGPFLYLYLKIFQFLFGYTIMSAGIFIFFNTIIFLGIIFYMLKHLSYKYLLTNLILNGSIILILSSNSIIMIISLILILLSEILYNKWLLSQNVKILLISSILLILATLTLIQSLVFFIYWWLRIFSKLDKNLFFKILITNLCSSLLALFILNRSLGFKVQNFFATNIIFNLLQYPNLENNNNLKIISRVFLQHDIFTLSAPILVAIFVILQNNFNYRFLNYGLTVYFILLTFLPGTDHAHYVLWLVLMLIILSSKIDLESSIRISRSLILIISLFIITSTPKLYDETKYLFCSLQIKSVNCKNGYSELVTTAQSYKNFEHDFIGNDPWPYVIMNLKPTTNFATNYNSSFNYDLSRHIYWYNKKNISNMNLNLIITNLKSYDSFLYEIDLEDWTGVVLK